MTRRAGRILAGTAVLAMLVRPAPAEAAAPRVLFTITDQRIDEASGIALGRASPGVFYVQNDSGDSSRFFALDRHSGATAATIEVPHARNEDWEDLAAGPDRDGTASVWLADIGDNDATRSEVQVYRVDEPRVVATGHDEKIETARPDVWRLRYPTGAANAESFAVTPAGVGYIVTKSVLGASVVYRVPARPDADHVQLLSRAGSITFALTGTRGGPNPIGQLTATGAAFSADGSVFAVRTYTDAYLWPVAGGDLAAALTHAATRIALPAQPQGEGIAFDGANLVLDSEGVGSAVYELALPPLPTPARTAPPSVPRTAATTPPVRSATSAAPPAASRSGGGGPSAAAVVIITGSAAVAVGALIAVVRHRRRPARYP